MRSEKEVKDLKNYAIALIRSGGHLLDLIDRIEKECTDEIVPPEYAKIAIKANLDFRKSFASANKTPHTKREDELWDALMKSIDRYNTMFQRGRE